MQESDVGRECVIFDRPSGQGNGLLGKIVAVYSPLTFRFRTRPTEKYPNGKESEMSLEGPMAVRVQFLDHEKAGSL